MSNQTKRSEGVGSAGEGPRFVVCETCGGNGVTFDVTDDYEGSRQCADCGHGDCAPGVRDTRPTPVEPSAPGSPVEVSEAEVEAGLRAVIEGPSEAGDWIEVSDVRKIIRAAYAARAKREGEGTSAWPTDGEWWAWHSTMTGGSVMLVRALPPETFMPHVVLMPVAFGHWISGKTKRFDDDGRWRFWPVSRPAAPGGE